MNKQDKNNSGEIIIYEGADGAPSIEVRVEGETVWLTIEQMAELFGKSRSTINEHILNIYAEKELQETDSIRKIGNSDFSTKPTNYYNLDVIISVGYRVKSQRGTHFRQWATARLHEYLVQGFTMNDEFYSKHSPQQIIENYIAQGKTAYDAISMMAETYLTDEDDFIVEGYQVTPEIVERIFKKFGKERIKAVFLVKYDEQKFIQDIHKSATPNDWVIRKTKDEATFGRIARMVAEYSRYFEKEAKKYGFDVFTMDEDFDKQLDAIENCLKLA